MREHLLGYLLDALDEDECRQVESRLKEDPQLQHELGILRASLEPLSFDEEPDAVPEGLAARTCSRVADHAGPALPEPEFAGRASLGGSWRIADMVVAAGVVAAVGMLFFPALMQSRWTADVAACRENLHKIGVALAQYSNFHDGCFPAVPAQGNTAVAGIYTVMLMEAGLVDDPKLFLCPGATKDGRFGDLAVEEFRVPTVAELRAATGDRLRRLQRTMGGSYGYHLGFVENRRHCGVRNQCRKQFALMADVLDPASNVGRSGNHGGCGQNVLFEDFHVSYLSSCKLSGCGDDYFHNDNGQIADGLHENDSVVAHSAASPTPATFARRVLLTPDVSLDLAP